MNWIGTAFSLISPFCFLQLNGQTPRWVYIPSFVEYEVIKYFSSELPCVLFGNVLMVALRINTNNALWVLLVGMGYRTQPVVCTEREFHAFRNSKVTKAFLNMTYLIRLSSRLTWFM